MKSNLGIKVSLNIQFSCCIIVKSFYEGEIILINTVLLYIVHTPLRLWPLLVYNNIFGIVITD